MLGGSIIGHSYRIGQAPGIYNLEDVANRLTLRALGGAQNTSGLSVYTFSGTALSEPIRPGDTIIAVFVWGLVGSANANSATIAGASAVKIGENDGTNSGIAVFRAPATAAMSTVTTAVTLSTTVDRAGVVICRLRNAGGGQYDSNFPSGGNEGQARTATVNIPPGGAAMAVAYGKDILGGFTGATEEYRNNVTNSSVAVGIRYATQYTEQSVSIQNSECRVICAVAFG